MSKQTDNDTTSSGSEPMRIEPLYFSWRIRLPSEQDVEKVGAVLDVISQTGEGLADVVYTEPGGMPVTWFEPHSLGEFFESVFSTPQSTILASCI